MAFLPRSFETILIDMINHVRANTTLTDFTVGSVIRTLLEAAALEDDEQYFQMVQLLAAFRIATATGTDLDERAADFNVTRLTAKESYGKIYITNDALTQSSLTFDVASGTSYITVDDGTDFPLTPPFFTVRVGEGTPQVEDVNVSSHSGNNLTLVVPLTQNHIAGERVALVSGSTTTIQRGLQVQVPPTSTSNTITFITQENTEIISGNYQSGLISIRSSEASKDTNVPAGRISQFQGSPPFTGAAVTNPSDTNGGRDRETDEDLRDRLMRKLDELSRGVPMAVESGAIGIEDPNSGQRVATAHLRENHITRQHTLYVDDGTGLVPEVVNMAATTLAAGATGGSTTSIQVSDAASFPTSGSLLIGPGDPTKVELVTYSAKSIGALNYLVLDAPVVYTHISGEEVLLVEVVASSAEDGQNFFKMLYWPVRANSYRIFDNSPGYFKERDDGTDFFLNRTNGDIEYVSLGVVSGSKVLAHYSYTTGLLQQVQKVLNGDPDDRVNYPGYVSSGIIVHVATPVIRTVEVAVSITVANGFDTEAVAAEVKLALEGYVNGLRIGSNVIVSKIIETAMLVTGVENVVVKLPTSDVVILEDELPVAHDSDGDSLVTVL